MIVLVAALIGAIFGGITGKRRNGNGLDIAQHAAGFAMAFVVVALIVTVVLDRVLS